MRKPFEKLTKQELWDLRQSIILNSLFLGDYENKYKYNVRDLSYFFEGYYDYLWELAQEQNDKELTHQDVMFFDTADNLYSWFMCYDDLSWIKIEE